MPRFVFELQAVLEHRLLIERQRQRELGEAQRAVAEVEAQIRANEQGVLDSQDDLRRNRLTGALDLAYIANQQRFVLALRMRSQQLLQKLALARQAEDAARKKLVDAARERKILQKLRERRFSRWLAEQQHKEAKMLDEVGMQMAFANHRDQGAEASQ